MQHTLCVAPGQSSTEVITVKLFKFSGGVRGEEGLLWGPRKGDAASSSPPALSPWVALLPGLCLTTRAGQCWHTLPSFLIGSSNGGEGWGIVSSTM